MHDPETYENNKNGPKVGISRSVPDLISKMDWKRNERILDYGCGVGSTAMQYFMPQAELHDSEILGVDLSEEMIAHAKNNYSNPRIRFVVGDILNDSFLSEESSDNLKFDKIFSIFVFHFIKNYGEVLKRLRKLLKPQGQFAFIVLGRESFVFAALKYFGDKYGSYMKGYEKFMPQWVEYGQDAEECFCRAIKSAGYRIIELTTKEGSYEEDITQYADLCMALNPFIKNFPADFRETILRNEYRQFIVDMSGGHELDKTVSPNYEVVVALIENSSK